MFLIGGASTLLDACGGGSTSTSASKKTLTYGAWQAPDTLDPATTGLAATSRIIVQVFDTLVYQLSGSYQCAPRSRHQLADLA